MPRETMEQRPRSQYHPSSAIPVDYYLFNQDFDPEALWGFGKLLTIKSFNLCGSIIFVIFLTVADLLFVILNLITPSRTKDNVIPLPFSPTSPPRFTEHPFIYCLCKITLLLGSNAPQWMQEWSRWDGVSDDGHWLSVDRDLDFRLVSRSPCPALNALANHGILKKSGEKLNFHMIASALSRTYNLSPALAIQLLSAAYPLFQTHGLINLDGLCTHGLIEHDASLLRPDTNGGIKEDQSKPHQELIEKYFPNPQTKKDEEGLKNIKIEKNFRINQLVEYDEKKQDRIEEEDENKNNKRRLKHSDLSNLLRSRREECKINNSSFHETFLFRFFGSGNCALLMEIFNGDLCEIRSFVGAGIPIKNGHHHHHHHQHYLQDPHLFTHHSIKSMDIFQDFPIDLINFEVLPFDRWRPSNLQHPWGLTIFKLIYSTLKIESRT